MNGNRNINRIITIDMYRKTLMTIVLMAAATAMAGNKTGNRKTLMNAGWQFALAQTMPADGWTDVTLPHDWSIGLPFSREAAPGNDGGYLPGGTGWYRTTLAIARPADGKRRRLYFEGVYERSEVYVNGRLAGGHPYGYTSFFVDITPYIRKGHNEIAVKADNSRQKNSRWYTGSGIYRNVWLIETPEAHIADWGVQVTTPTLTTARVATTVANDGRTGRSMQVTVEIDGRRQTADITVPAGGKATVEQTLNVADAKAWSPETPNMYRARITLTENGKTADTVEQPFGFRTISWSADGGLLINGQPTLLNGGCVHHDNGMLGAAAFDRAERRKAEQLKAAGFNAVRTSHNPPSEAFLTACDEIGLLVIDEAFDGWRDEKNTHDYHELFDEWAARDAEAMVLRDRNHPSIFCWSIGNEIIERKKPQAVRDAAMLAAVCHKADPTRPVTQALASWDRDWEIYDPLAAEHDIVGYNYMIHKAEGDHERVPGRVMMQTESYPNDAWKNYRTAQDHTYIIGDFVWTAIDYIGESGIGRSYYEGDVEGEHYHRPLWPWHAAYCGDIDLTGLRKPISHYRSMLWNPGGEHLYIAVREPDGYCGKIKTTLWGTWPTSASWNWSGHEGKPIDVEVYSHYPAVRLYLDGRLIGEKPVEEMKATFTLPYSPGTLRAEGIEGGSVKETATLTTAGEAAAMRLTADRTSIAADGQDLAFITIELTDADGHTVPVADNNLEVSVSGAAVFMALGNADIKDCDPYYDTKHKAWRGRALAIVRSTGKPGKATVSVTAKTAGGTPITRSVTIGCRKN